jgi:glycosyltransferase involved in cell wall biosynthesis
MRIGISCLFIDPEGVGGVNTFTQGLLDGFGASVGDHEFVVYAVPANEHLFARFLKRSDFNLRVVESGTRLKRFLCRASLLSTSAAAYRSASNLLFGDIRRRVEAEVEILYVPTVVLPFFDASIPTVLSMHDIQHVHYPEFFTWTQRLYRHIAYGISAECATCIQASSEFMRAEFLDRFPRLQANQVRVISEGVNLSEFAQGRDGRRLRSEYRLPERFAFCPAQLWPHKNHLLILRALKAIENERGQRIPLVLTGSRYSAARPVFDFIKENGMDYVHYLGKVPFADVVCLYQQAEFLVTASLYESNCLPILEAAAAGTPIVAASIPPTLELANDLRLNLFDPKCQKDLADVMLRVWNLPSECADRAEANRTAASKYSWTRVAEQYLDWFDEIVNVRAQAPVEVYS